MAFAGRSKDIAQAKAGGAESHPTLIIYYGDFDLMPELWIFNRRMMYHGWPIIALDDYLAVLEKEGGDAYEKAGFREYYVILRSNIVPPARLANLVKDATPTPIRNPRGDEVFRIYKFEFGE